MVHGVVCEEAGGGCDLLRQVVDVVEKQARTEDGPLRNARVHINETGSCPIQHYGLSSASQKALDPLVDLASDARSLQLVKEEVVADLVECLRIPLQGCQLYLASENTELLASYASALKKY
jgi:hypothetical protein